MVTHIDNNEGDSWVIIFGDFVDGALVLVRPDGTEERHPETRTWIRIPVGTPHYVEPAVGDRGSIAVYGDRPGSHLKPPKDQQAFPTEGRIKQKAHLKALKGRSGSRCDSTRSRHRASR